MFGCSTVRHWTIDRWSTDFENAERRAAESNRAMFIVYKEGKDPVDDPVEAALKSEEVRPKLAGCVRCDLYRSTEQDRRYAAQFGVERTPALILVHRDGTYHARSGPMSEEDIRTFFSTATPPGMTPQRNAFIGRRVEYHWCPDYEEARRLAERTNRPLLVVVYRSWARDWKLMSKLLSRPEVHQRFADAVQCRIASHNPFVRSHTLPIGSVRLPALVVVLTNGSHEVIEKPTGWEVLVRFADRAIRKEAVPVSHPSELDATIESTPDTAPEAASHGDEP